MNDPIGGEIANMASHHRDADGGMYCCMDVCTEADIRYRTHIHGGM